LEMADYSILYDDRTSLSFKLADICHCKVKLELSTYEPTNQK
jgi:hypothetical protein